jgi:replication factor A1
MKINEIKRGMANISIEGRVIDISEPRQVQTKYGPRNVADAIIEDDSGQVSLTLWEEKIKSISVGNTISINGAFVTFFKDKLQLNIPKTGKIEVLEE